MKVYDKISMPPCLRQVVSVDIGEGDRIQTVTLVDDTGLLYDRDISDVILMKDSDDEVCFDTSEEPGRDIKRLCTCRTCKYFTATEAKDDFWVIQCEKLVAVPDRPIDFGCTLYEKKEADHE